MRCRHPNGIVVLLALAVVLLGTVLPSRTLAAPAAGRVSSDKAELERAIAQLEEARAQAAAVRTKLETNSRQLDGLMAAQDRAEARLNSRVSGMYRTGETTFISVLMNAHSYETFASGWALLKRINVEDAVAIRDLKVARARAARSARQLLALQTQAAKQLEAERREVAEARKQLARSEAALAEYERRVESAAVREKPATESERAPAPDATQQLSGSGAWHSAVASHYGRNFTGGSASGTRIGPYSMICAHKTLPFGTLVEFEYKGKRAVASVVDRGPFTPGRTFDLGPGVVRVLDFSGVQAVRYRVISR